MIQNERNTFSPDYAVPPGEILEEFLEASGMKKTELAERTQLSPKTVSQIVNGRAAISPETAIYLERVLGVPATVWNNLDAHYRLHMAKRAERKKLQENKKWMDAFPIAELVKRGFLSEQESAADMLGELLDFFGVSNIKAWKARYARLAVDYRKSPAFTSCYESVAAWLRIGELKAESINTPPYEKAVFKSSLTRIRKLTREPAKVFEPAMKELCRLAGVALVFIPELPKTHLSGATLWLRPNKALIIMSLRHKSDDHFWFTFFHEAAHILLHGKKDVFIDEENMGSNKAEQQADHFATDFLIPPNRYNKFAEKGRIFQKDIINFSREVDLAPGIVVGRLQHDGLILYNWHNKLKRKFKFRNATQN